MANLTRAYRWEKLFPNLGENLELPESERLTLEVASGLPPAVLAKWRRDLDAVVAEHTATRKTDEKEADAALQRMLAGLAEAYAPVVRLVGTHSINGTPVTTLAEYLGFLAREVSGAGTYNVTELHAEVVRLNSMGGQQALFFERRSGGSASTPPRSAAKDAAKTGGR